MKDGELPFDELYSKYKHCLVWIGNPAEETKLTKNQVYSMLKSKHAIMLRNLYDWDCCEETNFWFIIKESYAEDEYDKKIRKYIQKANNSFVYEKIPKSQLLKDGYNIYLKAYSRYKINDGFKESKEDFCNRIESLDDNYEFWGAISKETGLLEAYSICKLGNGYCEYQSSKANPDFLPKYYIMYGLYDARNKHYLAEGNLNFVISSARSITEHSNIQEFMIDKFKFRKAFCRLRIYYNPLFSIAIKFLYPFRRYITYSPLSNLLKFEEINRAGIL